MNEAWKRICEKYIDSYKAIQTLRNNDLMDEEEVGVYEHNLLAEIIRDFESELAD